ncbi:MAG TPA: UdgX family uracil-DNA binding protein [Phycisphaerales bacterium]|nr:UdgX family uracil-DNA binding protein [Phycisphaerales bacterium]
MKRRGKPGGAREVPEFPSGGEAPSAEAYIPARAVSLNVLRKAVLVCRGCGIWKCGTRAVFGEGNERAGGVMFVGEQPGDVEEREGRPFVGPAGRMLDKAMQEAGIDRSKVYVTNAVKHFKFEPKGERRIHSKPTSRETQACRPWLEREIAMVRPRVVVALGATAAQSLLGAKFRVTREGGKLIEGTQWAKFVLATGHPSAILRKPSSEERREAYAGLVRDLRVVAGVMVGRARKSA